MGAKYDLLETRASQVLRRSVDKELGGFLRLTVVSQAWTSFSLQSGPEMNEIFSRIKEATDKEAGAIFSTEILSLFVFSIMDKSAANGI